MTLINAPALTAAALVAIAGLFLALCWHAESPKEVTLCSIFFGLLCLVCIVGVVVCVTPLWGLV